MKTLEKLASQRTKLPILNTVMVKDGYAVATDLDVFIVQPVAIDAGMYHGAGFASNPIKSDRLAEDFPSMPDLDAVIGSHTLDADTVQWVSLAQSKEETRYYLNGICFKNSDIVATNGHVLHKATVSEKFSHPDFLQGFIIPRNSIDLALKLAKETKEKSFNLTVYKQWAVFNIGPVKLYSKFIDGTFPCYELVIPNDQLQAAGSFNAKTFAEIAKRTKVLSKTLGGQGHIKLNGDGRASWSLNDHVENFDVGFALDETVIGFNPAYLANVNLQDAVLHYSNGNGNNPVKITKGDRLAVVMPIRV